MQQESGFGDIHPVELKPKPNLFLFPPQKKHTIDGSRFSLSLFLFLFIGLNIEKKAPNAQHKGKRSHSSKKQSAPEQKKKKREEERKREREEEEEEEEDIIQWQLLREARW